MILHISNVYFEQLTLIWSAECESATSCVQLFKKHSETNTRFKSPNNKKMLGEKPSTSGKASPGPPPKCETRNYTFGCAEDRRGSSKRHRISRFRYRNVLETHVEPVWTRVEPMWNPCGTHVEPVISQGGSLKSVLGR